MTVTPQRVHQKMHGSLRSLRRCRCIRDAWQLREIASVRGEVANLVRFTFAVGHATGCKSL